MGRGFQFYCGLFTVTYDWDNGLSWRSNSEARERELEPDALIASEKAVMDYLTEYGVENVTSVKLVEPKVPNWRQLTKGCNSTLQTFAEAVVEQDDLGVQDWRNFLIQYCGVEIEQH